MGTLFAIFFVLATSVAADDAAVVPQQTIPDITAKLNAVSSNETEMVDTARAFDKQEVAMATLDLQLAKELAQSGKTDEATEKKEQALKRYKAVREAYELVLRSYNNNARAQTYYGELLYDRFGEKDAALKAWQLAASLDKKLSLPLNDLAIHYCHEGQYEVALEFYDKAVALEPDNPDYLYNMAQMYLVNFPEIQKFRGWKKEKVFQEAMKMSRHAAELSPNDFELLQDYAVNFFASENFAIEANWKAAAKAWQETRKVAASPDKKFYTWLNEARVWIKAGNKTKAQACLNEALAIRPGNEVAATLMEQVNNGKSDKKTAGGPNKGKVGNKTETK